MKSLILIGILIFTPFASAQEIPNLSTLIQKTCESKKESCNQAKALTTIASNIEAQCESLKTQFGCKDLKDQNLVYSCDSKRMCQSKNEFGQCLWGAGEGVAQILLGIVAAPYFTTQFIFQALEKDQACFENKNNQKMQFVELFDQSIPDRYSQFRVPQEMKSAIKNWPCREVQEYLRQKNKNYQAFLGPLVAKGIEKSTPSDTPLEKMILEIKKQFGVRWECYLPHAKAEILCKALPAALLMAAPKVLSLTSNLNFNKVSIKPIWKDPNPQLEIWRRREAGFLDEASLAEAQVRETFANGKIKNMEYVGEGVMGAQKIEFENGLVGIWKPNKNNVKTQFNQREVAAFKVDEKLGGDLIPITQLKEINGRPGSIQLMATGLDEARFGARPAYFNYIDYLLANRDRHGGNYLTIEGRPVGIDHGFTFKNPLHSFPKTADELLQKYNSATTLAEKELIQYQIKTLLPKKQQFERLQQVTESEWRSTLSNLTEPEIRGFLVRRREIINSVNEIQRIVGNDIFPDGRYSPLVRYNEKLDHLNEGQFGPKEKFGESLPSLISTPN